MNLYRIESQLDPSDAEIAPIDAGLHSYNERAADLAAVRRFACYARDKNGTMCGGALARWWGRACELQQLWVEESMRRRGVGAALVQQVESVAIGLGCDMIYLDTFSWQAPRFYAALGYETAARLDGFPDGGSKLLMRKALVRRSP